MRFASWNVRGLNKSPHQKELQNFVTMNKVGLMGVLETKVKAHNALVISKKINRNWRWLFNYEHRYNGRIWVGRDPGVWQVSLHSSNAQCITCFATFLEKNITILVSYVYAFNDACDRVPLWNYCTNLNQSSLPWCLLGDFNCVLGINEISGGGEHWTPDIQVFKDCVTDLGLGHVRTLGKLYTWTNKRSQDLVLKRLDRMIANALWFNTCTEGNAVVHHRGIIDHNPLLYEEHLQVQLFGKPFQFFNFMLDLPGFTALISRAWSLDCNGNPMTQFNFKLKNAKQALRVFNKEHGNLHNTVHIVRNQLVEVQTTLVLNKTPDLMHEEQTLVEKLNVAILQEEHLLLQKSRVKWMNIGDGNNSFFHQQCKANRMHNKVLSLEDDNGDLVYGQQEYANVVVSYYQGLLANVATQDSIDLNSINCNTVTNEQSIALVAPVNNSLILKTLKFMKRNKALTPDGVNVEFFIATSDITGPSFCKAVKFFFSTCTLSTGTNSSFISLIPKVPTPSKMKDFRPI
ncbi:uncharacterized protein LOC141691301 [Apium graveolens]|uniref:uncharacterized protein LOC141691301 n=1 Tax=Apium graveolens TaxID=4045 RepID=UPI003D7C0783